MEKKLSLSTFWNFEFDLGTVEPNLVYPARNFTPSSVKTMTLLIMLQIKKITPLLL